MSYEIFYLCHYQNFPIRDLQLKLFISMNEIGFLTFPQQN
jgi:hypothetical protein